MRWTWLFVFFLAAGAACGGRQITNESSSGTPGANGLGGTTSTGAAGTVANPGAGGTFGAGGDGQTDLPLSRCSFGATATPTVTKSAPGPVVQIRISRFIVGSGDVPLPDTPAQVTPEWAADTAMKLLDVFGGPSSDAPAGFVRWLAKWTYDGKAPVSAPRWANIMAERSATLSSLIASPNPDNAPHGLGYMTDKEILTGRPSIDRRGQMVLNHLLCQSIPSPPPGFMSRPPMPMPGVTEREEHQLGVANPSCHACHAILDPFGHAFLHFDRNGEYRELDNGLAIDSSDVSDRLPIAPLKFTSIDDLAPQLAQSCDVARCVAKSLLSEAISPDLAANAELPFTDDDVAPIADSFVNSGFSMRALVRSIVSSPAFLR